MCGNQLYIIVGTLVRLPQHGGGVICATKEIVLELALVAGLVDARVYAGEQMLDVRLHDETCQHHEASVRGAQKLNSLRS